MLQFIGRRILLLIPTLIVVSIMSFVLIQLPPGDYLTTYIASLEAGGLVVQEDEVEALKRQYGVTVQHTYVQVDQDGNELAKWTGSVSGEDIAAQTV